MTTKPYPFVKAAHSVLRAVAGVLVVTTAILASGLHANAENSGVVPVAVTESKLIDYQPKLTLSGAIAARSLVNVSFRVNGQVVERMVEIGQHVEKGAVLARIDNAEQQSNMRVALASKDAAQAQLVQAEASFKRQEALLGQGFTTRSQYDQSEQVYRTAQSTLMNAESQLGNARDELSYTELHAPFLVFSQLAILKPGRWYRPRKPRFRLPKTAP